MRKYSGRMKSFQCICILLSLLLLLTAWINIKLSYDFSEYGGTIETVERLATQFMQEEDEWGYYKFIDALLDAKLTPLEVFLSSRGIMTTVKYILNPMHVAAFLYLHKAVFAGAVVSGILAILSFWCEAPLKWAEKVFFAAMLLMVFLYLGAIWACNNFIYYDLLGMTAMPYLAVILALPIRVKSKLPLEGLLGGTLAEEIEQPEAVVAPKQSVMQKFKKKMPKENLTEWVCKQCGKENMADSAFCSQCGQPRPQKVRCEKCGEELADKDMFCRKCGTPRKEESKEQEKQDTVCEYCGSSLDEESVFCGNCGAKVSK